MSKRLRAAAVVALSVGFAGSVASYARAQEKGAAARDNPTIRRKVELTIEGESDQDLAETIRELVGRLGIEVVRPDARGPAEGHDFTLARVWIDFGSYGEALIVVSDVQTGDVVLRRSVPKSASIAIFREEVAHAVHSAVQAELLVEQDRVASASKPPSAAPLPAVPDAVPPAAAAAPAPPGPPALTAPSPGHAPVAAPPVVRDQPPAYASRASSLALDVTTLVGVGPFASGSYAVPRVIGGAALASRKGRRPSIALSVAYAVPFDDNSSQVDARANVLSLRAVPGIELVRTQGAALGVGAGGGMDALTVTPGSTTLPLTTPSGVNVIQPASTRMDPILVGVVEAHFALAAGVVLTIAAGCDFDLESRRYVVLQEPSSPSNVFVPWRVRPSLVAGFTFTALGEGLFASRGSR